MNELPTDTFTPAGAVALPRPPLPADDIWRNSRARSSRSLRLIAACHDLAPSVEHVAEIGDDGGEPRHVKARGGQIVGLDDRTLRSVKRQPNAPGLLPLRVVLQH